MTTIVDFVGEYTIKTGSGAGPVIEASQRLYIGTGEHDDPPPHDGKVGVSIYDAEGDQRVFPADPGAVALFAFQDENCSLAFEGSWRDGSGRDRPLFAQISLARRPQKDEERPYRATYAVVLVLDPDQTGTWGADDQP